MSLQWNLFKRIFQGVVRHEALRFENSLKDPRKSQEQVLRRILSDFGVPYTSVQDFQNSYRPSGESQLALLPLRMKDHRVVATETTSGSSGRPKLIPYTEKLMGSFHRMFRLWAWDVLSTQNLNRGVFFFSISPQVKNTDLQEDSDYLQSVLNFFMKKYWAVDAKRVRRAHPEQFMKALSFELLMRPDLEIISVWSPSYLLTVFKEIESNKHIWCHDLNLPAETRKALSSANVSWKNVWPSLRFVSVWGSGFARAGFAQLQQALPGVCLQAKGLLATEAPMTIPWSASGGFVPMLNDVFFEFLGADGSISLLHELQVGEIYEIIITTFGGLFRYRLGDQVKVSKIYQQTPCLDFVGRTGDICDLVGEKLSEWAVRDCLKVFAQDLGFSLVIPDAKSIGYILLTENESGSLESKLDQALQSVFHYQVARDQGQLQALQCVFVPDLKNKYYNWLEQRNMRLGDIKEKALLSNLEQAQSFLKFVAVDLQPSSPSVPMAML